MTKFVDKQLLSLISLCKRAGHLKTGEYVVETALRKGEAQLVLIAGDASDNTKKKFVNKSFFYKVPCFVYGDSETLSKAIGSQNRKSVAITDKGFAESMIKILNAVNNENNNE